MTYQLIWSKGAVEDHTAGRITKRLLAHRISNVETLPKPGWGFIAQMPKGTPYIVLDQETGAVVASDTAQVPQYV